MGMEQQTLDEYAARLSARIDALRDNSFRAFADSMPGILWTADRSGQVTFFSRRWYEAFGVADMDWLAVIHPDDHDGTVAAWRESVASGQPFHRSARFHDTAGNWHMVVSRAHIARAPDGSAAYWLGTSSILDTHGAALLRAA